MRRRERTVNTAGGAAAAATGITIDEVKKRR